MGTHQNHETSGTLRSNADSAHRDRSEDELLTELKELHNLHLSGSISEDEYEALTSALLEQ